MKINIDRGWRYIANYEKRYLANFPEEAIDIDLPHINKEIPFSYFSDSYSHFISTYQKKFKIPKDSQNKIIYLVFDGFMLQADIYLNGRHLGNYLSGFVPVKIDVTDAVHKDKENILLVVLDSNEDPDTPPFGLAVDYYTFGGIYRDVFLEINDRCHIENLNVFANKSGKVQVKYDLIDPNKELKSLSFHVVNNKDELLLSSTDDQFMVPDVKLWSINNPVLYKLIALVKTERGEEKFEKTFGFRDAIFKKDGFYLNGERVKLIGLNRHQCYPYIGYAATKRLQEEDAEILKNELCVNVVRTSHYPQSEYFLDKCDELGLLVIDEIPGWQHIGQSETWRNRYYYFLKEMLQKEASHPSLIAYGVRIDESQDDHELYFRANQIVKNYDQFRQTLGVRNFKNSELLEDIYAYNDFSSNSLKKGLENPKNVEGAKDKPYIVTEYMGHMHPTKAYDNSQVRLTQALRYYKVLDDAFKYKRISGAIGWCFVDYYTHADFGSGDHICHHGVMDLYRNPKRASSVLRSLGDKERFMEILSEYAPGDNDEAILKPIYVATNLDYVEVYRGEKYVATFYPDSKHYPHFPHPPIVIDDLIGATFLDHRFNKLESHLIVKLMGKITFEGFSSLKFKDKLFIYRLMKKKHLKYPDLVDLFNKYVSTRGGKKEIITIKGYYNRAYVTERKIGPASSYSLKVLSKQFSITEGDTYEILPIHLAYSDNNGNIARYTKDPISIKIEGPLELIGPSTRSFDGGMVTFYFKTIHKSGIAKIEFKTSNDRVEIEIKVN
jgi:beta-galactosidase